MAQFGLNYPAAPAAPIVEQPTAPVYADPPNKKYRQNFNLFGFNIPYGPTRTESVYDQTDPAVRALYGLDDPNRNASTAQAGGMAPGGTAQPSQEYTPYTNYGTNDTGRTLSPNPHPSYSVNSTIAHGAPTYPDGSGTASRQNPQPTGAGGSTSPLAGLFGNSEASKNPFLGFLGALLGINGPTQKPTYEAALRERPEDIQRLVSMTRRPPEERSTNAGGFLGGMFDPKE